MTKAAGAVTAAAFVSIFVYALCFSLISVTVNDVVGEFSLFGTSEGLMSSSMSLGGLLALLIIPFAQGRVNKIIALVFAGTLQAIALLVCGVSPDFFLFCIACAFTGVGGSIADAYCNSSITDIHKARSPRYLGYLHGIYGIGSLLGPVAIYALLQLISWRGAYAAVAVAMIIAAAAVLVITRGNRGELAAVNETKIGKADIIEYIRKKRNIFLCLTGAFATAAQTGVLVWVVRYMSLRFGADALGAVSLSVFWICATISRFLVVRLKLAPMRLLIWGSVLGSASIVAGVLSASAAIMCAMLGVLGFAVGNIMPVIFSECAIGYESKTTFSTSAIMLVMGVTRIIAPLLMAYFSAYVSVVLGMLLPAAFALIAAGFGYMTVRVSIKN